MTYEEAITLMHTLRIKYVCTPNHCGLIKNGEPCVERNCDGYHDALAMAIEVLELIEWMEKYIPSVLRHSKEMKQIGVIQNDE